MAAFSFRKKCIHREAGVNKRTAQRSSSRCRPAEFLDAGETACGGGGAGLGSNFSVHSHLLRILHIYSILCPTTHFYSWERIREFHRRLAGSGPVGAGWYSRGWAGGGIFSDPVSKTGVSTGCRKARFGQRGQTSSARLRRLVRVDMYH